MTRPILPIRLLTVGLLIHGFVNPGVSTLYGLQYKPGRIDAAAGYVDLARVSLLLVFQYRLHEADHLATSGAFCLNKVGFFPVVK